MNKKLNPSEIAKLKNKITESETETETYKNIFNSVLDIVVVTDFKDKLLLVNKTGGVN